eukprot:260966-Pyramimonas_sp.AAC.1
MAFIIQSGTPHNVVARPSVRKVDHTLSTNSTTVARCAHTKSTLCMVQLTASKALACWRKTPNAFISSIQPYPNS